MKNIFLRLSFFLCLLLIGTAPLFAVSFNKKAIIFTNHAGWQVPADQSSATDNYVQSVKLFQLSNGVVVDDVLSGGSSGFIDKLLVGTIAAFAIPTTSIHAGWMPCDGRTLTVTPNSYLQRLAKRIGTTWGGTLSLDAQDQYVGTMVIPDMRGIFLRGASPMVSVGTYQDDAFQNHSHDLSNGSHTHPYTMSPHTHSLTNGTSLVINIGGPRYLAGPSGIGFASIPSQTNTSFVAATASSTAIDSTYLTIQGPSTTTFGNPVVANETRPVNQSVNYCIFYGVIP